MRKLIFGALGVLLLIVLLFLFLKNTNKPQEADDSIKNGYVFLKNSYNADGSYNDEYLKYVYSGESLYCPLTNCKITYRILDSYFDLVFIKEFGGYGGISDQVDHADKVLSSLLPLWRNQIIYNTKKSTQEDKDGIALDTYCILGYIYLDEQMAKKVLGYLDGDKWLEEGYYKEDVWRNVADESWCIRLVTKTKALEKDRVSALITKKIDETDKIVYSSLDVATKSVTVIHMIYTIYDFSLIYNDNSFDKKLKEYQYFAFNSFSSNKISGDDLILANMLDSLAYSKYDKSKLKKMANVLIKRQKKDGGWYTGEGLSKENAGVFTTLRVIIALKNYGVLKDEP